MSTLSSLPRRTLIVLTSHAQLGSTGKSTGAYLAEITHAYWALVNAGIEVDFVSPAGGQIPLDGIDRKDADNARFLDDAAVMARLHASFRPDQIDASRYAAIYFAGGHGTMWDLPNDTGLARIAAAIYEAGGIVSAVCHGPAGLVNIKLSTGDYLVAGKQVAAFTDDEERAVKLTDVVPFLLASTLIERGARHVAAPNFSANVVVDQRVITGQNPASARGVGEALVVALTQTERKSSLVGGALSTLLLSTLVACAAGVDAPAPNGDLGGKGDLSTSNVVLTGFEQPEAVAWDDIASAWYVSNFGGPPKLDATDRDGDGFVSRISTDGAVETKWITGLDAPKGMRLVGRTLFVVDVGQVLAIDVDDAVVTKRYPVGDSIFLNDIDVAYDGTLFVSDTLGNKIFQIAPDGTVGTFASGEHLNSPNGIRIDGDRLVVAGWGPISDPATFATSRPGDLYSISFASKALHVIAAEVGNLDGLERIDGGFLVTSWAGTVLAIDDDGRVATLEDRLGSAADVSRGHGWLAVPSLLEGTVTFALE